MDKMRKFGFRMAALVLCLFVAAMSLSSCGFFVDSYLADYTDGRMTTAEGDDEIDVTVSEDTTAIDPPDVTEPATEATTSDSIEITEPPVETTEPALETTVPETTDNIPDDVQNNVYLSSMDEGRCGKLVGNVTVTVILLNDSVSSWDEAALTELRSSLADQEKLLENDASGYGKQLDITFSYINATVSGDAAAGAYSNDWVDSASKSAGFASLNEAQKTLDNQNGADSNPIVYALNKTGRAYATQQGSLNRSEYLVLFSSDFSAFRHELYHLYGAEDFYYPELVDELALQYLPDSIMNDGETTDALTAFIIGWDEELDADAYEFLKQTSHLTQEYLDDENEKQSVTGFVTDHKLSYGTYTGYLERGIPTGEGTVTYEDGATASGNFIGGSLNGYGIYTWANGDKYSGDWVMGKRTGKGTYTWAEGGSYTGDFVNGINTGSGVYTYPDGSVYDGEFLDGKRQGSGTMRYENGAVYVGSWENGEFNGTGKYTLSDGSVYEGSFSAGVFSGRGTMAYASGDTYVGEWSNNYPNGYGVYNWKDGGSYEGNWSAGKFWGTGKQVYANGSVYEGEFANGLRNGSGVMHYAGGDVYTGEWKDGNPNGTGTYKYASGHEYSGSWVQGTITGYGVMKWANGASYDGNWLNGKRHGYGKYTNQNGRVYEGSWVNDVFQN